MMSARTNTAAKQDIAAAVNDAIDDIECAIATINDLLRLALDDLQLDTETRAGSAIRGAKRFIDDIGLVAVRLSAETGYGSGGAA